MEQCATRKSDSNSTLIISKCNRRAKLTEMDGLCTRNGSRKNSKEVKEKRRNRSMKT